jgi:hypothetical protein
VFVHEKGDFDILDDAITRASRRFEQEGAVAGTRLPRASVKELANEPCRRSTTFAVWLIMHAFVLEDPENFRPHTKQKDGGEDRDVSRLTSIAAGFNLRGCGNGGAVL